MADTPRGWAILQTLQARLQTVTVANGYRTDLGMDVRLERNQQTPIEPYVVIYSGAKVRPDDARTKGEREFTMIVEAHVPTALTDAHRKVVDITEDIEDALDAYLQQPLALPLDFIEAAYLDAPDGLPVMASQSLFATRYRR